MAVTEALVFQSLLNIVSVTSQWPVQLSMLLPAVLFIGTLHNILSKLLAASPHKNCQNDGQQSEIDESCHNDCHQSLERNLTKPGIEPANPCNGNN